MFNIKSAMVIDILVKYKMLRIYTSANSVLCDEETIEQCLDK